MDYNNLSKQPSNHYLGVVVNFKDQKELGSFDLNQSGKYIILNLCHHFDPQRSFTSLTLVRDSFGIYTNKNKK